MRTSLIFAGVAACLCAGGASLAGSRALDFEDGWDVTGEAAVEEHLGERALRMRSGRAVARDVRLEDGTIELDVATTGHRSFVYVQFRMQSDGEHEELYFRPHKSGLPDAIQYTPVFREEGNWQLYHGEGFTAAADFPRQEWVHLKIVLSGARVAVFVGDASEPQLVVHRMARESAPGYVALRSFLPGGQPENVVPTSFANVVVRPDVVGYAFEAEDEREPLEGVAREWLVSEPFLPPDGLTRELPTVSGWRKLPTDDHGLLVIGRHLERPEGARRSSVLARLTLTAERPGTVPFHLGYSDEVTVFLDGEPLLAADDSYRFDRPRREGLIGFDQATVFLPLRAGDNELVLLVTDGFGGFGVMGRLDDAGDAAIAAR